MEILSTLTIFIVLVIAGSLFNNVFSRIPAALFQIVLGALVTFLPLSIHLDFESETFMMLIIAPLLFTDAFNANRKSIWLYKRPILYMAILLVLVTVLLVGTLIYLIVPGMPLAASYVLAAILSPTDAVAVKSITKGMKLPKGLMAILEGESLLNDASGIVSFNIALGAILTNTFTITGATQSFIRSAIGGAILGIILGIIFVVIKTSLIRRMHEESNVLVIFQLFIPAFVYFIAENHYIHVSGIVAVVVIALLFNLQRDLQLLAGVGSEAEVISDGTQITVSYILNGFVFTILGYLLPDIYITMFRNREIDILHGFLYSFAIVFALMVVRFLFVYFNYVSFQQHNFTTARKVAKIFTTRHMNQYGYSRFRYALVASLCGIHGTVTLATAFMIPVTLTSGGDFPLHDTIMFIASNVILLSIVLGTILLPFAVKKEKNEYKFEQLALREKILEGTLKEIKERDISGKTIEEQIAYGIEIINLHAIKAYFRNMQTGDFSIAKDIHNLHKKVIEAENAVLEETLGDNPLKKN